MNLGELNKYAGAFLGALLLFLLLGFFSEKALKTGEHGQETLAYALEIEDESASEEPEEEVDLVQLASNANADNGETIFRQCSACHKVQEERNGVGPHLVGVVGRQIAALDGYSYSDALSSKDGEWGLEALSGFLENPQGWAPGTKMGYSGLSDPKDRVDVIAYLNQAGGSNVDLTAGMETASAEDASGGGTMTDAAPADAGGDAAADEAADAMPADESDAAEAKAEESIESAAADDAASEADETAAAEEGTETAAAEEGTETAAAEEGAETAAAEEGTETATEGGAAAAEEMEMAAADTATGDAAASSESASLFANVSVEDGAKVWNQCRACHVVDQKQNRVGPHLVGVVGREVASVEGYNYSGAMKEYGGEWTPDRLSDYLENPRGVVEGTKMAYRGLKDAEDRAAVIKYLNAQAPEPVDLN